MRASLLALTLIASTAAAQEPESVIPWLTESLRDAQTPEEPRAAPLTGTTITARPLGQTRRDAVGLLSPRLTGLPATTFVGSDPARLARLIERQPDAGLPAMHDLLLRLLLAETDPPRAATDPDRLFFARVDALIRLGALDQAQALLERAGATDAPAFRRWWDVSLLTGVDDRTCATMTAMPGLAPSLAARVFCLSRGGDWAAAALTLQTANAVGAVGAAEERLLATFLDPELFEGLPPPVPPRPMTPLAFRLLDGIGEAPSTRGLPLAYAVADLRPTTGWKAQIDAAERLTRARALDPNRLLALYTEGRPSASGGVWDRAAAVQALDAALTSGATGAVAEALTDAIAAMDDAGLTSVLADLYGARLSRLLPQTGLDEASRAKILRLTLLSSDPNVTLPTAQAKPSGDARLCLAVAAAQGGTGPDLSGDPLAAAVAEGLRAPASDRFAPLLASDRLGEALLQAALLLEDGARSDPNDVTDALALFNAAGLPDVARAAAVQLLLL